MSIWDKYKLKDLPAEQQAEVIKIVVKEMEETERTKLNSDKHNTVRGLFIGFLVLTLIPVCVIGYYWVDGWKAVRLQSMTPVVCPAPPPCSATPLPAFDIKVVPAAPTTSK